MRKQDKPKIHVLILLLLFLSFKIEGQNSDIRLLRDINSSHSLVSDDFMRFMSDSEVAVGFAVPAGLAVAGLIKKDEKTIRSSLVIFGSEAVAVGLTTILKYSVNRDRPFVTYPDINQKISVHDPSFPSGHTSNSFSTAMALSLEYPKWYVIVPSFGWAGTVAYSRMSLGVHYPSDVVAGALIGIGSGYLSHMVNRKLKIGNQRDTNSH
jgi:membrane-associated phospholipid phosphatase